MYSDQHSSGKGDRPRSGLDRKKFNKNMDKLFPSKQVKTWDPNEEEETTKSRKKSKD